MKPFTKAGAVLLILVALLHLVRLITRWEVVIGDFAVPVWISAVLFAFALLLGLGLWKESSK